MHVQYSYGVTDQIYFNSHHITFVQQNILNQKLIIKLCDIVSNNITRHYIIV